MADLLWDVRTAFEEDEKRMLEKIINTKAKNHNKFWIFKHSNWRGQWDNVLKTTYMIRSFHKKPPRMLGTKLWLVDRAEGRCDLEWELPLDILMPEQCLDLETANKDVYDSAVKSAPSILLS